MTAPLVIRFVPEKDVQRLRAALRDLRVLDDVDQVLAEHGQTLAEILGPSRLNEVSRARFWLMHVVRELTGWSYPHIGRVFHRDHTTVMAAIQQDKNSVLDGRPFAPMLRPWRETEGLDDRAMIAKFLQHRADQLHREGDPAAIEVERLAGVVRRGEDKEKNAWTR